MMADRGTPFLDPLWRRILLVCICAAWAAIEIAAGEGFWTAIAVGMTALGAWQYLWTYKPSEKKAD